jgi:predicted Zn-dependent protease
VTGRHDARPGGRLRIVDDAAAHARLQEGDPLNQVMAPGDVARDQLIADLDRGLLVTRFHYTNPVHPKLALITGMTRDGTFLVEGGRIVGPVRNLRFTQSYLAAMAGTGAVARERKTLKGFLGGVVVPALRIDGWTFTGTTEH